MRRLPFVEGDVSAPAELPDLPSGSGKVIKMPKVKFVKEHKKLIGILTKGTKAQRLKEAKEQMKELKGKGYKFVREGKRWAIVNTETGEELVSNDAQLVAERSDETARKKREAKEQNEALRKAEPTKIKKEFPPMKVKGGAMRIQRAGPEAAGAGWEIVDVDTGRRVSDREYATEAEAREELRQYTAQVVEQTNYQRANPDDVGGTPRGRPMVNEFNPPERLRLATERLIRETTSRDLADRVLGPGTRTPVPKVMVRRPYAGPSPPPEPRRSPVGMPRVLELGGEGDVYEPLKEGEDIDVVEERNGWYLLRTGGQTLNSYLAGPYDTEAEAEEDANRLLRQRRQRRRGAGVTFSRRRVAPAPPPPREADATRTRRESNAVRGVVREILEEDVYQMFLPNLPTEQARSAMREWIRSATTDVLSRVRRGKGIVGKGVSFDADGETFTIKKDLAYDPKFYVASKNLAHLIAELTARGGRKVANLAKLVLPTLRILADEVLPPKGIKPTRKQVEGHYFFAKRVLEDAREIIKRYYDQTGLDEALTAYAKRTGRRKATPEVIDEIRAAMKAGREADLLGQPIEMFLLADAPPLPPPPPPPARKAGAPPGLEGVKPTGKPPVFGSGGGQKAGFIRRMMGEIKLKHGGEPYGDEDADASYRHPTRPLSRNTRMDAPVAFDYFKMPKESRMRSKHIMNHLFRVRPYTAAEREKLNEYEKGMLAEAGVRGGTKKSGFVAKRIASGEAGGLASVAKPSADLRKRMGSSTRTDYDIVKDALDAMIANAEPSETMKVKRDEVKYVVDDPKTKDYSYRKQKVMIVTYRLPKSVKKTDVVVNRNDPNPPFPEISTGRKKLEVVVMEGNLKSRLEEAKRVWEARTELRGGKLRGGMEMGVYPAPPPPLPNADITAILRELRPQIESDMEDDELGDIFRQRFTRRQRQILNAHLDAMANAHEEDGDDDFNWRANLDELIDDLERDVDDDASDATISDEAKVEMD
jgi:hypothetical protein